jgi:hypothetical protein
MAIYTHKKFIRKWELSMVLAIIIKLKHLINDAFDWIKYSESLRIIKLEIISLHEDEGLDVWTFCFSIIQIPALERYTVKLTKNRFNKIP